MLNPVFLTLPAGCLYPRAQLNRSEMMEMDPHAKTEKTGAEKA